MVHFYKLLCFAILIVSFGLSNKAYATHGMGADLYYERISGNQYKFYWVVYRDCSGIPVDNTITMNITSSCITTSITLTKDPGTGQEVSPLCPADLPNSTCNGGSLPGVQRFVYTGTYTLPCTATNWVFSVGLNARNTSTNIQNSGADDPDLYVRATLNNSAVTYNNSPTFVNLPVPYICLGQPFNYNHGAVDPDGDQLVYSLVNALGDNGALLAYAAPYSATYPVVTTSGTFPFDGATGAMSFTPSAIQRAVVAVRVDEYRSGVLVGSTMRDIQVVVQACAGQPPAIPGPTALAGGVLSGTSIYACPGVPLSFEVVATDPNGNNVTMSSADFATNVPGATLNISGNGTLTATGLVTWTPTVGDNGAHTFTVSVHDDACSFQSTNVYTYTIDVGGAVSAGADLQYCGQPVQLFASGGGSFTWAPATGLSCTNCANPVVNGIAATQTYTVTNNCGATDEVVVHYQNFSLNVTGGGPLCTGQSSALNAAVAPAGVYTYSWTPTTGLSCSNCANPTANPSQTTTYTVSVNTGTGCILTQTVTISYAGESPVVTATSGLASVCPGASAPLDATPITSCTYYQVKSIQHSPIAGNGTAVFLTDDGSTGALPIGFTFRHFCNNYTNFYINANGFISFSTPSGLTYTPQTLPNASTPNNMIALCWDDLNPAVAGSTIDYFTTGVAPNRKLVVNFRNVAFRNSTGNKVNGQIILNETSNASEIHITSVNYSGSTHVAGIKDAGGTLSVPVTGRNNTNWTVGGGEAWRFVTPTSGPFSYNWLPATGLSCTDCVNPTASPMASTTYTVTVTDNGTGCTTTSAVAIAVGSGNPPQLTALSSNPLLCAGGIANLDVAIATNANDYRVTSISYAPTAGSGTAVALTDDGTTAATNIGFTFNYFGTDYTQFYINANGFISFSVPSGITYTSQTLPNATAPNNLIALCWDDLNPTIAGSTIEYFTTGSAPNRKLVVNFTNVAFRSSTGNKVNGQIVLHETTNLIDIFITSVSYNNAHTLGIENQTGSVGVSPSNRNNNSWTVSGASSEGWRFLPPSSGPFTYAWTPTTGLSDPAVQTPTASPTSTTTYTVTVTDQATGCAATSPVTVTVGGGAAPAVSATANTEGICPGQTFTLNAAVTTSSCRDYSVSTISYNPVPSIGTSVALTDDGSTAALNIGFTFNYFCTNYTQFYINANGFISFSTPSGLTYTSQTLPDLAASNNLIALCWDDLNPTVAGSRIDYFTTGTAPYRKLVVTFHNVAFRSSTTNKANVQAILYETTNVIEIHVRSVSYNNAHTLGIEDQTGTHAYTPTGKNNAAWTVSANSPQAFRFSPAGSGPYTYAWSPAAQLDDATLASPVSKPSATTVYTVVVTDTRTGCTTEKTMNLPVAAPIAGSDESICPGASTALSGSYTGATVRSTNSYGVSGITHAPIAGTGTLVSLADDGSTAALNIGFAFNFYGTDYTQFYINANGFIAFATPSGTTYTPQTLPNTTAPNNLVALCWDDLNPAVAGSQINYFTVGTAPNRKLIVNFKNVAFRSSTNNKVTGQIILYENTNVVEVHLTTQPYNGSAHTIGVEKTGGSAGTAATGRNNAAWRITTPEAWRFTPNLDPVYPTYSWSPATYLSATNVLNPTVTGATGTTTYTLTVNNGICTMTDEVVISVGAPSQLTWTGAVSNDWFTPANWSGGCLPACGTNVFIPNVSPQPEPLITAANGACKTITIYSGGSVEINNGFRLDVCGDFVNNGLAALGAGTVAFVGNANQNFTDNTHNDLPHILIDNGLTVTLQTNMTLAADKTLGWGASAGRIVTGANEVMIKNNAANSVYNYGLNGYVQGNLRREVAGTASYDFPVGLEISGLGYQLANITFTQAPAFANLRGYFIDYASTATPSVSLPECSKFYNCILNDHGKWVITPNAAGFSLYDVTLYPRGGTASCVVDDWTAMKQPDGGAAAWALQGDMCSGGSTPTRTRLSSFSEFAALGSELPFPVEWLNVQATPNADHIRIEWLTATEQNNKGFFVEKSIDGQTFAEIGFVESKTKNGAGSYALPDFQVAHNVDYYYRIRQVDFNGQHSYSQIVQARIESDTWKPEITLYPNPNNGSFQLSVLGIENLKLTFSVYNHLGQRVKDWVPEMANGQTVFIFQLNDLANGLYHLSIQGPNGYRRALPFVKQ